MKAYIVGELAGGVEFRDWPVAGFRSPEAAQRHVADSYRDEYRGRLGWLGLPADGPRRWVVTIDGERDYPETVVFEVDIAD